MTRSTLSVQTPDGAMPAHLWLPEGGTGPGVLLLQEIFGVSAYVERRAQDLADEGYVVLAPNVFHREGSVDEVGPHADLMQPGERDAFFEQAMPRVARLTPAQAVPDIAAYLTSLRGIDGVAEGPVGVVGYCMGARLAVRAGTGHPEEVAAVGGFHGGGLVTDDPDSPHRRLADARAEFVFGHADQDRSMPAEAVAALGEALDAAGLVASNQVYPGAVHGYTMADTPMYDEQAAERHFTELRALLERAL